MTDPALLAWVGLGSNLEDPPSQLRGALERLDQLPHTRLLAVSAGYSSPPMGPADQPDYLNAVAAVTTTLEPLQLLDGLQQIEQAHQRRRSQHWGPRTLDLDLLLYGAQSISLPRLQVPHPGMAQRAFVLWPLMELVGEDFCIPGLGPLGQLVSKLSPEGLERLGSIS